MYLYSRLLIQIEVHALSADNKPPHCLIKHDILLCCTNRFKTNCLMHVYANIITSDLILICFEK